MRRRKAARHRGSRSCRGSSECSCSRMGRCRDSRAGGMDLRSCTLLGVEVSVYLDHKLARLLVYSPGITVAVVHFGKI